MKILVTGAAGFIGYHTSRFLLERGDQVVGFDNFNPYYDVSLKELRNTLLEEYSEYRMYRGELADKKTMEELFSSEKFDVVCNLAAQAGVRHSLTHPHDYISSNIMGFLNILEGCRHEKVSRLVYASSSSVYGGNTKLPFSVDDRVDNPVSLYAASKKSNELMAHSYSHLYDFQTIGHRFFTVYGPLGRPDMMMWLFADAILKDMPVKLFNNGDMQRDFTYIDDIVSGLVASMDVDGLDRCEVFNLGNNNTENLMDVVAELEKNLGKEAIKEHLPMQMGDVKATFADIEASRQKLGFDPKTSMKDGVVEFIKWFKEYKEQQ